MGDDTYDRVINPFPRNKENGKKENRFFEYLVYYERLVLRVFFDSLHFSRYSTSIRIKVETLPSFNIGNFY